MANSPARSLIDVGSVIADTYTIEALIGRGGMGAVFQASHKRLPGKKVAIKLLHAELTDDDVLARFKREAEIASRLGHPNIVAVHDFNVTPDGTPYLVLELLEGESLAQRLREGPIPLAQVFTIVRQIGSALAAAHREGIVHRDLKPQNIFLVQSETDGHHVETAKVLDFGISKIRGSQTVKTQESTLLGTPQYMAPEQALGQHDKVDERTDVFALGAIVYEMLCGHPAFSGANIPEVVFKVVYEQPAAMADGVLPEVAAVVTKAMSKPADDRYATVGEFVEALTGQPLVQFRGSRVSLSPPNDIATGTGRRVNSGQEAFAQTMGSGDHGEVPHVEVVPGPSVRGSAPTVDSQSRAVALVASVAPAVVDTALPATTVAPNRRTGLVIGLVLGGIVTTAAVMFFVMQRGGQDPPATPPPKAPQSTAAGAVLDAAVAIAPVADAAQIAIATPADAAEVAMAHADAAVVVPKPLSKPSKATGPARADVGTHHPVAGDDDDPIENTLAPPDSQKQVGELLRGAEQAVAKGDFDLAERFTNQIFNSAGRPKQLAQARAIHGIIECLARNNQEGAQSDLRALERNPFQRKRILDACHAKGMLEDITQ